MDPKENIFQLLDFWINKLFNCMTGDHITRRVFVQIIALKELRIRLADTTQQYTVSQVFISVGPALKKNYNFFYRWKSEWKQILLLIIILYTLEPPIMSSFYFIKWINIRDILYETSSFTEKHLGYVIRHKSYFQY